MSFTVTIGNVRNVIGELNALTTTQTTQVIARMSEICYEATRDGAGKHKKTGALEQSVYNRVVPGGRAIGHDGDYLIRRNGKDYAEYVLFGSRPHTIRNKKVSAPEVQKKALRFISGGNEIFARFVNHPGYIGDNYLFRAGEDAVRQFRSIVDEVIK
jgi:hypothetical protein